MAEYLLLMHDDADTVDATAWPAYFMRLRAAGIFEGGSAIGPGACERKRGAPGPLASHLAGYIRIAVPDLDTARTYLAGNPVYEAGGTVELRELSRD